MRGASISGGGADYNSLETCWLSSAATSEKPVTTREPNLGTEKPHMGEQDGQWLAGCWPGVSWSAVRQASSPSRDTPETHPAVVNSKWIQD